MAICTVRDAEMVDKGGAESSGIGGIVRVVGSWVLWIGFRAIRQHKHDMYVIRLGGSRSWNARAIPLVATR